MRIMHFAGGGDVGGAKTHIISLGQQLARDNDFCLVSFRKGPFAEEAEQAGLQVVEAENAWNLGNCLNTALKAVDNFHPDVIHCHGAKANMLGVMVKKLRHIPVCTTVHSDPARDYLGSPVKQLIFGSINSWALRRMDYYMAVAGEMERTLIRRGIDPQHIFVIHNGLDFSRAADCYRGKGPEDEIVVGIAARLTPIKNIPLLLRAFAAAYKKNPRLRLKIAGTGEDEAELKKLSATLGIDHCTDFVGWVYDMPGFFRGVDINVLSSLSETFPYSLLEGAFEHCAAIASRVGGIPEMIRHGETGLLFESQDEKALAEHIYRLSTDEQLRRRLADNLFELAKNEFSLDNMRRVQEHAYVRMVDLSSRRGRQGAVICGAYGRGNAGDEAILRGIVSQMRSIDPEMPMTVLSRDKLDTRLKNHTNAIHIFNVPSFLRHLRHARIFINGGGSLIQDVTSSRSLYFYLFTLWAARLCGCRVIMYGCGIGPIRRGFNQRLAAGVLDRNVEIITLRDSKSMDVLKSMKVERPRIYLTADPTVNFQPCNAEQTKAAFAAENIPDGLPKIGFCLRNWPSFTNYRAVAKAADYAYQRYGLTPVFLPIEFPGDVEAAAKVRELMHSPSYECRKRHEAEELLGMLGSMKLVVGMRLHSLIFATTGGAPVVGISYDVKVDSFLRDIGSESCIPLSQLSYELLKGNIDKVIAAGDMGVSAAREKLQQGQQRNIDSVRELLGMEVH